MANADRDVEGRAILRSLVSLARSLGARVVAEAVETEAERAACEALGVDCGQGWLFGYPEEMPGARRFRRA